MKTQSDAVEDYLKAIFEMGHRGESVTTGAIAEKLDVAPASVTAMLNKLQDAKLVFREKYKEIELTKAGEKIALEVIRHHRLVEAYLAEAMNVPWDRLHEEAEKWEHVLSEYLEEKIDELLGHPKYDPHGSPIPSPELVLEERELMNLWDCPKGTFRIAEVSDGDGELLRHLDDVGLVPGAEVSVLGRTPIDNLVSLSVQNHTFTAGQSVGTNVFVHAPEKE
jgi:DtxR family Mn-dependent transcriptional regulator